MTTFLRNGMRSPLTLLLVVVLRGAIASAWISPTPPRRGEATTARQNKRCQRPQHPHSSISSSHHYRLQQPSSSSWSLLYYSTDSKDEAEGRRRRMEIVRSLQTQFYAPQQQKQETYKSNHNRSSSTSSSSRPDVMLHLPLWQVPWLEIPGRTNVWNVFEPIYTNMLETILHSPPPWYVGHLYHCNNNNDNNNSKESGRQKKNQKNRSLQTWQEYGSGKHDNDHTQDHTSDADVLGTLLRIVDYRRMDDGRLLLLVQGLERFVVTEIVQELPYAVAHVQLLPDLEEFLEHNSKESDNLNVHLEDIVNDKSEADVAWARARAVASSFQRWHRYEFEQTVLPLPLQNQDLRADQVLGGALAKVLPYAPFSSVVNLEQEKFFSSQQQQQQRHEEEKRLRFHDENNNSISSSKEELKSLEYRLLERGIFKNPVSMSMMMDPSLLSLSSDELEIRVWLALNNFLQQTRKPVSPILLGFLPHNVDWSTEAASNNNFVLEQIAQSLEQPTKLQSKFVRLSPLYPALRRQKRLSFTAPALLEHSLLLYSSKDAVNELRRQLLAIPSTKLRLAYLLQLLQDETWGAFQ